ncbi:GspE/PulE/PilB domain-containing protein [Pararhodobacter zhoushanensis]|uniref:Type II secretion system protein GspE N-terminal domain-containing protein n=1 Tax=Pararhodobacter zhoushanensis TaxID=2479545 RepID=A0ABT3GX97_9RHOB|nr:hypothetical protein [Pararhodobacter zhoushanensis]MCW1932157.1 hypothetical protein [Pararhodobacter zhoushanensis]
MRALEIQTRQHLPLGDILRAHGLASETAVMAALAEQFGTGVIDTTQTRPDPRLIDRVGPRRCLRIGCLPWSRAGSVTLVACAEPDQFFAHRAELEAALGPVVMGVVTETDLQQALIDSRSGSLRLMAETCVAAQESCRLWDGRRFSHWVATALASFVALTLVAPVASFLALFGLVLGFLTLGNAMKVAATVAQLRASQAPPTQP